MDWGTGLKARSVVLRIALALLCLGFAGGVPALANTSPGGSDSVDAVQVIDRAVLRPVSGIGPGSSSGVGEGVPVRLPDAWNGRQREGTWIYETTFHIDSPPEVPWGLYVPRAGNRYAVYLNGRLLGQLGAFAGDLSDYAQRPSHFFLPADSLRRGDNQLRFVVQGERARYAGLSTLKVGPADEVRDEFMWREAAQVWGSFAIIFVSVVFGLIAAGLAFTVRDRIFTIFALACLFCTIRTSYAIAVDTPFDYRIWNMVVDLAYAGYLVCLCLFAVRVLELRRRWILWVSAALVAASLALVPLYAWARLAGVRQVWLMLMLAYAATLCFTVIACWWRTRTPASRMLALAGAVCLAFGAYDHLLVFYTADGYSAFALTRFSLITFLVAMGWLLVDRYARNAGEEKRLRAQVADELARKKAELEQLFDRQQQLVSENAQKRERSRMLEDLHDGMGLQLNGLLGMVQTGPLQRDALAREIRTAIEQMRMLIDSTEAFDGDLSLLLGHIRYRIEQRLKHQGVELRWDVQLADPERTLPPQRSIALQRLVFELTTNTLKHAHATVVELSASDGPHLQGALELVFRDNGRGFSPDATSAGVGTRSIHRRVADLDASLSVDSVSGGGTRYCLRIPPGSFMQMEPA